MAKKLDLKPILEAVNPEEAIAFFRQKGYRIGFDHQDVWQQEHQASFTVAKTQRDNRDGQVDTSAWVIAVWIAFATAILLTGWGLWRMTITEWQKYYMLVSWLFMVSSTFTLAKTVRDAQEATLLEQRSARARAETDAA